MYCSEPVFLRRPGADLAEDDGVRISICIMTSSSSSTTPGPDLLHHLGQAARHLDRHRVPGRQVTNYSTASGHVTTIITSDWSGTSPPSPGSTSSWAAPCPSRCTAASCRHPGTLSTIEHPDHCVMRHPYSVILSDIFRELNPPYLHLHDSPVVRIENMDRYCPLCILL